MSRLQSLLEKNDVTLPDSFYEKAEAYKTLLMQWNKIHNITGAKNGEQIDDFIADAVYPVTFLPFVETAMDIGTGAGFPGMVLALAMPKTQWTLVEPITKRSSFLQFVKANLELENVDVKSMRVEQLPPTTFDLVTSRAVTDTQMLLKLSTPYCKEGTLLLFYKGEKVYDEIDPSLDHTIIEAPHRHYLIIKR